MPLPTEERDMTLSLIERIERLEKFVGNDVLSRL